MKKGKHPAAYRFVIFQDISSPFTFLGKSTAHSEEMAIWDDGKEYPVIKLSLTSGSHPFFTGQQKYVDSAGRIEKFQKKYQK